MKGAKSYIVGKGAVCALGNSLSEIVANIEAGKSGVKNGSKSYANGQSFPLGAVDGAFFSQYDIADRSAYSRLEQMMISSTLDAAKDTTVDFSSTSTLFIFSTTKGNIDNLNHDQSDYIHSLADNVVAYFKNPNKPICVSNACISGVSAVIYAHRLIQRGEYKNIIVVGGDLLTDFVVSGFDSFRSLSHNVCKPYDKDRDGISLGEGASSLILSSETNAPNCYYIAGGATSNDANHISGPSRTGEELAHAITTALNEAGLKTSDVSFVNMHGTATVYNDEMESKALAVAGLADSIVVSTKGYFGHTLGCSGVLELAVSTALAEKGKIAKTLGFEETGTPVKLNVSQTTIKDKPCDVFMKTGSGFGGCNAAVVVSNRNFEAKEMRATNTYTQTESVELSEMDCNSDFKTYIKGLFASVSEPYMKFSKMDDYCRLGTTAVQLLLDKVGGLSQYDPYEIALIVNTDTGCIESDLAHWDNITADEYVSSPAIFVYTLPNVVAGEICIKNKFKGEGVTLVGNADDPKTIVERFCGGTDTKAVIYLYVDKCDDKFSAKSILFVRS
ncbi:MAG: beta-ketoacyl synthase N-terminal-like domain-containing protein [Paludibacteraceae bacterium]|nr:beta-ketoacyl synthase N-terminal-like domain-containing protein [Paludibacteraceae bacterium]